MIKLKAPVGHTSVGFGGNQFAVTEDGTVQVPAEAVQALRSFGFVDVPAEPVDAGEALLDQVLAEALAVDVVDVAPVADATPAVEADVAPDPAPAQVKASKGKK